ncbi:MAG: cell envelope integrity protein CreD [Bacteroidales bacterium]|nr:cell envelope integrity protein CreD [Bacteroidales bacterium]
MKFINSFALKIVLVGILALAMLIPLQMISGLVRERQNNADETVRAISDEWSRAQTLAGPRLVFEYEVTEKDAAGKTQVRKITRKIYPDHLKVDADIATQLLHRSIYDVMVYRSDLALAGDFVIPEDLTVQDARVQLEMELSDLRGIEGEAGFTVAGEPYRFTDSRDAVLVKELKIACEKGKEADIPFAMNLRVKGSKSMSFKPVGGITEVTVHGDCPTPSFKGDFLPAEREIRDDGFSARWIVSQINRGGPEESAFQVDLLQKVTQYQQATRTLKYGLLIIALVFIAGLIVELVGKREISIIQYLVIGLSLVLFYALVLSFSEFMSFGIAYALAAAMTTLALLGYFRGILKDRSAYLLVALVALAYIVSYVLLQMETYALLTGSLILFLLLAVVMYFTRNLNKKEEPQPE